MKIRKNILSKIATVIEVSSLTLFAGCANYIPATQPQKPRNVTAAAVPLLSAAIFVGRYSGNDKALNINLVLSAGGNGTINGDDVRWDIDSGRFHLVTLRGKSFYGQLNTQNGLELKLTDSMVILARLSTDNDHPDLKKWNLSVDAAEKLINVESTDHGNRCTNPI
jgi:hypothetical protein